LGRGGGFYDRLLADRREGTRVLGVAFAFQMAAELPLAPHDVRMDAVATDTK
jgi:5,10-methenyltetrahydrofolate synthetase